MDTSRIEQSIDVEKMQSSHVTLVGGGYGLACDLVRSGLGAVSLVDFDSITSSNPARQDFYSTDINRLKVEATANTIQRINPEVEVEGHVRDYCAIPREEHDQLFGDTDLFIYATDSFPAQALGNLEALRLNKPAIWIGLYRAGRAGEIIYYMPGVTEACYRCICPTRYQAFQNGGASVSSAGGTIFDLRFVDAVAGPIAVGLLTYGADNRFGQLIPQLGQRNLIQVKMDPNYRLAGKDIFAQYLGDDPANFSFTTIAVPMERDIECPDCARYHQELPQGSIG